MRARTALALAALAAAGVLASAQDLSLPGALYVTQDGKRVAPAGGAYPIRNAPFSLVIRGAAGVAGASLFFAKESAGPGQPAEPTALADSAMFSPGNAVARPAPGGEAGLVAYFDSRRLNNYVGADAMSLDGADASVLVRGFAGTASETVAPSSMHCYVFVDLDADGLVERGEVASLVISIRGEGGLFAHRTYVSTVGYTVPRPPRADASAYAVYRITSFEGLARYRAEVAPYISNLESWLSGKDRDVFAKYHVYIVRTPATRTLSLGQPYKYAIGDSLVFDATEAATPAEADYVSARNYVVPAGEDRLRIVVNEDGLLIVPETRSY